MSVIFRSIALLFLSYCLLGCVESAQEEATGRGKIRGMNALADSLDVNFLIEERGVNAVSYKEASAFVAFDDLTYTFNFDISIAGQIGVDRIASVEQKVVADNEYFFTLAGSVAAPEILVWENVERVWDSTETVFEMAFGHASPDLGTVDVYFAPTGTAPVVGDAIGTLSFGERLAAVQFDAGEFQLTLTAPGDPATVLFKGAASTPLNANSSWIVMFDADPSLTSPIAVQQILRTGTAFGVPDSRFAPTTQLINAAFSSGNIDLVIENDFINPPTVSNLAFGEISDDVNLPAGTSIFTYTPPASTTVLLEEEVFVLAGIRMMIVLQGEPGNLSTIRLASTRRPVSTAAQLRITNVSFNLQEVDVYLSADGSAIGDLIPNIRALPFGLTSDFRELVADTFELTITTPGETTVLAGPVTLDMSIGDVVEILIMDTADPVVGEILEFTNLPGAPTL